MARQDRVKILGIDFINSTAQSVVDELKSGGLMVVPSGPGLETIKKDTVYYQSLLTADIVLPDSGYMALIWNTLHRPKLRRISGLEFLVAFFNDEEVKKMPFVLVDPRPTEANANRAYLNGVGFNIGPECSYLAPMYDKNNVVDEPLLQFLEQRKPRFVLINLGGGIQEKLGAWLRTRLSYKPGIICTGAAIAFLTGHQAHIPTWADRLYLGWLVRCISNPRVYIPRYFNSIGLLFLMLRYGARTPS